MGSFLGFFKLCDRRFADGPEKLIRNATINGISLGNFKDILAVSDTPVVWNASFGPRVTDRYEQPGTTFISLVTATGNFNKPPPVRAPVFFQSFPNNSPARKKVTQFIGTFR